MGNHDYHQNPIFQVKSKYFNNNHFYFKIPFSKNTDLFFIDTVQLFPNHCGITSKNMTDIFNCDFPVLENAQLIWLENELINSGSKNKIVFGHYPIVSNGLYANHMQPLFNKLIPLFKKYNVRAYISGHEHNVQYIERLYDNYHFRQFIVGCSSEVRKNDSTNIITNSNDIYDNSELFYIKICENTNNVIIIQFINTDGVIKYSFFV